MSLGQQQQMFGEFQGISRKWQIMIIIIIIVVVVVAVVIVIIIFKWVKRNFQFSPRVQI